MVTIVLMRDDDKPATTFLADEPVDARRVATAIDASPPKAKPTLAEVNELVAEIKQELATKSLIAIDIPKWYRQPYEDARLSADLDLMHARAIELLAAVKKIVVDEKLVTSKLAYVKQVIDLRKPGVDPAIVQFSTAQLDAVSTFLENKRIEDANRALTALYNEIAKWPKPGTAKPAPGDDVWK